MWVRHVVPGKPELQNWLKKKKEIKIKFILELWVGEMFTLKVIAAALAALVKM